MSSVYPPLVLIAVLTGCAACEEPPKEWARDRDRLWMFVAGNARCNLPDRIFLVLDEEAQKHVFQREAFVMGLSTYHTLRRYLWTCQVHRNEGDRIRLCNPVFGFHLELGIKPRKLGKTELWTIVVTREDVDRFLDKAKRWLKLQVEANQMYFNFPPDWDQFVPLEGRCGCEKAEDS